METSRILIIGSHGQLGNALQVQYPDAVAIDRDELDVSDSNAVRSFDWSRFDIILNASGYTNVDGAETPEGRIDAWQANVAGVRNLADIAITHTLKLVHISTDYVFDGSQELHAETEPLSPLGVYAQTKAAGDAIVSLVHQHYLLRVSWVIGSGKNFVRSIAGLADRDISPSVVADQFGRLTFTTEIARAIDHLLKNNAEYGTYNFSNDGDIVSWADVARQIYQDLGRTDLTVSDTTAAEYFTGKVSSPRPAHSGLDLSKIKATGFEPHDWRTDLTDYLKAYVEKEQS